MRKIILCCYICKGFSIQIAIWQCPNGCGDNLRGASLMFMRVYIVHCTEHFKRKSMQRVVSLCCDTNKTLCHPQLPLQSLWAADLSCMKGCLGGWGLLHRLTTQTCLLQTKVYHLSSSGSASQQSWILNSTLLPSHIFKWHCCLQTKLTINGLRDFLQVCLYPWLSQVCGTK